MSDSNSERKTNVRQSNASNSNSNYYDSSHANMKLAGNSAKQGFVKSAGRYTENISGTGPSKGISGALEVGTAIAAGRKEWGQAIKYGANGAADFGKGAYKGFSDYATQGKNPAAYYNKAKINESMTQKRSEANQIIHNRGYTPKAHQTNQQGLAKQSNANTVRSSNSVNKGISSFQSKSSTKAGTASQNSSNNHGISSFRNKSGGQSTSSSSKSSNSSSKSSSSTNSKGR